MRYVITCVSMVAVAVIAAGCGSSGSTHTVPSLGGHASAGSSSGRIAQLHAVAQCIRQNGIPNYPDPVITARGQVYDDQRSLQDSSQAAQGQAEHACGALAARAGFNPGVEAPAPPQLVAAGVRAAHCLRANGMTNYRDPNASTPYVPGHGFSLSSDEVPPGGKADPTFKRAAGACRQLLDAEITASTLSSLGDG